MKVFILSCLVALALATSYVIKINSSDGSKLQMVGQMEQLQARGVLQNNVHPFIQSQPQGFPYEQPISCTPLAQNAQPIAQASVVPSLGPVISPEVEAFLKAKAAILSKQKAIHSLNPETVLSLFNPQVLSSATLANQHIPQSQVQLLAQVLQAFLQTPVASSQTQLSLPQSKVLYLLQQVTPFLQKDMSSQTPLQFPDLLLKPTLHSPAQEPAHPITVSLNLLPFKFPSKCVFDEVNRRNAPSRME
uniref:Beta-casein n=1 Tax=Cricetulus griseus TaxID=10029 RepID=A0A8C2N2Q0_CRIGR